MKNDPRGSIWNQWDLHFHTPASFDYPNKSITSQEIIDGLLANEIRAIAITDHHTMDLDRIGQLQSLGGDDITIFPGVEFRSELGAQHSVHYIGIFPEDCDLTHVWDKLKGVLGVTKKDIDDKGGDERFYVPFMAGVECIHSLGGLVSVHAGSKSNSFERIANAEKFKQQFKKDMMLSQIDIVEIGQAKDEQDYRDIVFPAIGKTLPIVICSDNHNINKYERNCSLWIKADPTFAGLRHVLNEPIDRVFLGDVPKAIARLNGSEKTKIIRSIEIRKKEDSSLDEKWFDCEIPLNTGLVAIIGNKGSGKSALADVIGLLGESTNSQSFSFLHMKRFCQPKQNRGQHFKGTITWESGGGADRYLHQQIEPGTRESVRYLPQKHLEDICNELANSGVGAFADELKSVIFSHVKDVDRLGKSTLDELIGYRVQETEEAIHALQSELRSLASELAKYERQLTTSHRRNLEQQLTAKQRELIAHDTSKPADVKKPEETTPEAKEKRVAIEAKISAGLASVNELQTERLLLAGYEQEHTKRIVAAQRLMERMQRFQQQVESFYGDSEKDCLQLALVAEQLLSVEIDTPTVEMQLAKSRSKLAEIQELLNKTSDDGLPSKIEAAQAKVAEYRAELDQDNKRYQKYLSDLEIWNKQRSSLEGNEFSDGTVKYLESEIKKLGSVRKR